MRNTRITVPVGALALALLGAAGAGHVVERAAPPGAPAALPAAAAPVAAPAATPLSPADLPLDHAAVFSLPTAGTPGSAPTPPQPAAPVLRSRTVAVTTAALPYTPAQAAGGTDLALFDDTVVHAQLDAAAMSPAGYQVWQGAVSGSADSSVVLVEDHGVVTGTVIDPRQGTFAIRAGVDGRSVVEQLDPGRFPDHPDQVRADAPPALTSPATSADGAAAADGTGSTVPRTSADADAPTIDIAIGYSTAARNRYGSTAAAVADAALSVEQANNAFAASGITARLRLVGTAEVPDDGDIVGSSLDKLVAPHDGWNDQLPVLREQTGADVVALVLANPGYTNCGMAGLLPDAPGWDSRAYLIVDSGCATGNLSFTHELGHVMGADHDRGAWSSNPYFPYGYGWVNPSAHWRTVMAYANACPGCTRILRFSNPDLTYGGARTGAPIGTAAAADNHAVLNQTAPRISTFRTPGTAAGTLTVTGPVGPVTSPSTSPVPVAWTATGELGSTVKVELLRGSTVQAVLTAGTPILAGSYTWTPSATAPAGPDYRIRVTSIAHPEVTATSSVFAVTAPQVTLAATGSPLVLTAGVRQTVSWSCTGTPTGSVRLELVRAGQVVAVLSAAAPLGQGGTGSVSVTPPALPTGSDYQLRATLTSYPTSTTSAPIAYLGTGALTVTSPNGGESWRAGTTAAVTWTATSGLTGTVKVELVRGGSAQLLATAPVSAGAAAWLVPVTATTGDYQVRVTSLSAPLVLDSSDATFRLSGPTVTGTTAAAPLVVGAPTALTWTSTGVTAGTVKVELVPAPGTAGTPVVVSAGAPVAAGSLTWTSPATLTVGTRYRVRLTLVANPAATDLGTADLTVTAPTLTVSPGATTGLQLGAPVDLTWQLGGGSLLPTSLSLVQGERMTPIASGQRTSAGGAGTYRWTPPLTLTPGAYSIRATAGPATASTDSLTLVRPTFTVSATSAGSTGSVTAGRSATVSWQYSAPLTLPVRLDLLRGTALVATLTTAGSTTAGTGTLTWPVPAGLSGGDYQLRATPSSSAVAGQTVDVHVDGPTLALAEPVGSWTLGAPQTLTWTPGGGLTGTVRLELVPSSGAPVVLAASVPAATGTATVTPPVTMATTVRYRLRATVLGTVNVGATSTGDLGVQLPALVLAVTGPGGPSVVSGQDASITWSYSGPVPVPVRVQLLRDGVVVATPSPAAPTAAGTGTLIWPVPATLPDGDYQLRATPTLPGLPGALVALHVTGPTVAISSPSAWTRATTVTATWSVTRWTGPVRVELLSGTRTAAVLTTTGQPDATGTGTTTWTVPSTLPAGTYTLRASVLGGATATSGSFSIS